MKILGIDPGFGLCGFALLEKPDKGELILHTFGVIRTEPNTDFGDRLLEIAEDFQKILDTHRPDVVSIEDLFFVKNVTTGMGVAHARGVLMLLAKKFGVRIVEPKPVEIKSCFTGSGKADKRQMKKMAELIFGLECSPKVDDAVDAIAAAYFAVQSLDFLLKK